ncbi:hypothetical protein Tco_1401882 [Tanacetum coccineum]
MPRILIPLRPILGVLQIGIKSQGYREPDQTTENSPGVDGPPIMPEVPPSPDYIPGPEGTTITRYEPGPRSQSRHTSPIYIPCLEPFYPEFLPSDPEEDLEEGCMKEIPEENHPTILLTREDDDDDAEEGDHDHTLLNASLPIDSIRPQSPAPDLWKSRAAVIRQRDALPSPVHETEMLRFCFPHRNRHASYYSWSLGYEDGESSAAGAKLGRAIQEIAPTTLEGVNQRVTELVTTVDQEDEIIYSQLDDARYDRALLRARVNMLYRDRPFHRRTALLIEEEARLSRAAWARSMDACDQVHSEGISLRTTVMAQQSEITELQAADRRRQSVISDLLKADYRRQRQLVEALKIVKSLKTQMIELQRQQGPAKDPAEPELPEEASSSS